MAKLRNAGDKRRGAKMKKASVKQKQKQKATKIKESVMLDIPNYAQTEEFTSSAACAMMVLKYINPAFQFRKENEYSIWQEAVNGSVWHGSKYGIAYALAKRGAKVSIVSNVKDEGYDKKIAVYENVNLDTLIASFNEIKGKAKAMKIEENYAQVTPQGIKRALSTKHIPIVLMDARIVNQYLEPSPHWVVVKGYDKDTFYINDPYSNSTITIDADAFKSSLGFDNNYHMIVVDSKHFNAGKQ